MTTNITLIKKRYKCANCSYIFDSTGCIEVKCPKCKSNAVDEYQKPVKSPPPYNPWPWKPIEPYEPYNPWEPGRTPRPPFRPSYPIVTYITI